MLFPYRLEPGDTVDIVAPASACSEWELLQGLKCIERLGLVPRYSDHFIDSMYEYMAQTDDFRFQDLKRAISAPDSRAIWCVRGGYGSLRLIPRLLKLKPPKQPKIFIGLSDITSLHIFFNEQWGWPTLHGPMLGRLGGKIPPRELIEVENLVFGIQDRIVFNYLVPMNRPARQRKTLRGRVGGGNLLVVHSGQGTKNQLSGKGRFILIEEINERGYRVDRMLESLHQGGLFNGAKAVIFGDFVGGEEASGRYLWKETLDRFAEQMKIPVLKGIQSGHGWIQRPVPFESPAVLQLRGRRGELTVRWPLRDRPLKNAPGRR